MDVSLSCRVAVLVLNIFSHLSVVRQSSPQAPPFLHILLHYKDHSLFRACEACHKKASGKNGFKFRFFIFEGCFVLPTENRENFTRQQSQSLTFSDSSRPGGYRSLGKVARPGKTCFNIKDNGQVVISDLDPNICDLLCDKITGSKFKNENPASG